MPLAVTEALHATLSGPATMAMLRCALEAFGDASYARLTGISYGHPYDLRRSRIYARSLGVKHDTRDTRAPIGIRRKPRLEGRPGWVHVDSMY